VFILLQEHDGKRTGDTMVLDSVAGHRKTFEALKAFLASEDAVIEIAGEGPCHLCPDDPTLRVFRMLKSSGRIKAEELPDGVLQVSGRPDLLARYVEEFLFEPGQDGDHRHPELIFVSAGEVDPASARIIIEVDSYADDPERWAADNREEPA